MTTPNFLISELRVDLTTATVVQNELDAEWLPIGGRTLTSQLIAKEVDPTCHPLGADNKLIFAIGPLAGSSISNSARISVGAKSPLTGGIKESNSGGVLGSYLGAYGIRCIVFEGAATLDADHQYVLVINSEGARLDTWQTPAGNAFDIAHELHARYGSRSALALTGPAAQLRLSAAGINFTDPEGRPGRLAARGGLGAVMGAKRLLAVVAEPPPRSADRMPKPFVQAGRDFAQLLLQNPVTGEILPQYGTASNVEPMQQWQGLPTRNFQLTEFEHYEEIGGQKLRSILESRPGAMYGHRCMPACTIRCSNIYPDADGEFIVSPLEYESIALLGSNLEIADYDQIARLNEKCNAYGLDTIEIGAALGVLMEAGVIPFGDATACLAILDEIAEGAPLGRVVGSGAATVGRVFGVERIPAVKGQAISGYDPRTFKGTGVTYATSPMGGDHTAGLTVFMPIDHSDPAVQKQASRQVQIFRAALDGLGLCSFAESAVEKTPEILVRLVEERYGLTLGPDWLQEIGQNTLRNEVAFNRAAGLGPESDRLPTFFEREPAANGQVFDVSVAELDDTLNF